MPLAEIILVPHSHTDLGFTHDQPVVDQLHRRFLDHALDLCEAHADAPPGECFHWTIEVCGMLEPWLRHATAADRERLRSLEARGLIELGALPFHLTPLADATDLREAFGLVRRLREEHGLHPDHAVSSDVNGQNWPLVDVLLDHGVRGFSSAINTHFGRAPFARPNLFLWQAPSGRTLPAFNGFPYGIPGKLGLADTTPDSFAQKWLPRLEARLEAVGWTLPVIMLQCVNPFGDNAGPDPAPLHFARAWNAAGRTPRLTLGTPRTWWERVRQLSPGLPVVRGDWTDFWNFGCLSAARDLAAHRRARVSLRQADALTAQLAGLSRPAPRSHVEFREAAWAAHTRWQEHTWTADCGAEAPLAEDVAAQSAHKTALCYTSRSLGLLLRRDALIALADCVPQNSPDDLLLVNPVPWPRVIAGLVNPGVGHPRGLPGDPLAGAHFQDRKNDLDPLDLSDVPEMPWKQYPEQALLPVEVPACTAIRVPRSRLADQRAVIELPPDAPLENDWFHLVPDFEHGGVVSVVDRRTGREWVDASSPWRLHHWVCERLAPASPGSADAAIWPRDRIFHMDWAADAIEIPSGWNTDWPALRSGPDALTEHRVVRSPLGLHLVQWFRIGGRDRVLRQEVFMPDYADWIECRSRWLMEPDPYPQAHYLVFPFALTDATARVDLGGAVMRPGEDQLPGCCHDYFTAQGWVDLSASDAGVTVAVPENPMVQFGDFSFGLARPRFEQGSATVLGWATANYWHCNFPASQPGWVRSRYRLDFHNAFDEARAHRFAAEAAEDRPVLHAG